MFSGIYAQIAKIDLWFKVQGGDPLTMADIPALIPLRWTQLRDKWEFLRLEILNNGARSIDSDAFKTQFDDFSDFIAAQRSLPSFFNPLSDNAVSARFSLVFEVMPITIIPITNEESRLIAQTTNEVKGFTKQNFVTIRSQIELARDEYAAQRGTADSDYNRIYSRPTQKSQVAATVNDMQLLQYFQDSIRTIDFIIANILSLNSVSIDPFLLAKINANNPDIKIGQYANGQVAKLNYGEDLAGLAARTLGEHDRWIEIAIANGLKPPYIDEIGKRVFLISNASANQINIAPTDIDGNLLTNQLFVNQLVALQSNTQPIEELRAIVSIKAVPISGDLILELSGASNLSRYKISDNASVRIFQPNTVNSSLYLVIPSKAGAPSDVLQETPWFLKTSSTDEQLAKIDLMLSKTGDLMIVPSSDVKLSFGIENAIQAIQLKLTIELGELKRYLPFGLRSIAGLTNKATNSLKRLLASAINEQIAADSRFDGLKQLSIEYYNGNGGNTGASYFSIQLTVKMAGSNTVIPISFTVAL